MTTDKIINKLPSLIILQVEVLPLCKGYSQHILIPAERAVSLMLYPRLQWDPKRYYP